MVLWLSPSGTRVRFRPPKIAHSRPLALCLWLWLALLRPPAAAPPGLLLTELLVDPAGRDAAAEWVELANLGGTALDLATLRLGDAAARGSGEGMAHFPPGARLDPGQVLVVARSATGFQARYGQLPDLEFEDSHPAVPDMQPDGTWAHGAVALANDGDELLLLDASDRVVDGLSYGESTVFMDPAVPAPPTDHSLARVPAQCDTDSAQDWQPQPAPTPGRLPPDAPCPAPPVVAWPPVGTIQGNGPISPRLQETVTFQGVVTGLMADRNTAGVVYYTLFVQDEAAGADGDPDTSDGVALFAGRRRPAVQVGDLVQVRGRVTEYFGLTELDDAGLSIRRLAAGAPLPPAVPLQLPSEPAARAAYLESLEGMRVRLPEAALVVGASHAGCGLAVSAAAGPRPFRRRPEDTTAAILPVINHTDVDCRDFPEVKFGDRVAGIAGVLTYQFDAYRLVLDPAAAVTIDAAPLPPLPSAPRPGEAEFSVGTVNLENLFDAHDDTGDPAEPTPPASEIAVRQTKLSHLIGVIMGCPTLVAVQAVENESLLQALAERLQQPCRFTYRVTHRESPDRRGIDVALLSHPGRVVVSGVALHRQCTALPTDVQDERAGCPPGQFPLFSRPPLEAIVAIDGRLHRLVVVHLKSKRGGAAQTRPRRQAQAAYLAGLATAWLDADPAERMLLLGDLNDVEQSAPVRLLTGPLDNLLLRLPPAQRYSYVFGGEAQLIDGLLATPALADDLVSAHILHVNADFPAAWGLATDAARLPYHSTDHDPPLAIFRLPPAAETTAGPPADRPEGDPGPIAGAAPHAATPHLAPGTERDRAAGPDGPRWGWLVALLALALLLGWGYRWRRRP